MRVPTRLSVQVLLTLTWSLCSLSEARSDDFDRPPVSYSDSTPDNIVSRWVESLGDKRPEYDPQTGYLPALLEALDIPPRSQVLVFSKTSLQRSCISPATPRALYFNDDVYVGYCHDGDVLEISVADENLGTVFYTVHQRPDRPLKVLRQTDTCLSCHASSQTQQIPGHIVRSVFSRSDGFPLLAEGTFRIDHTSPFENRWGGWYVTGTHGDQRHLGNLTFDDREVPRPVTDRDGLNVTSLADRFDTSRYLTPHSDIVALMILEHQTKAHNLITRANFQTRQALYYEQTLNEQLGEPQSHRWESTTRRLQSAVEPLIEYLLMQGEAPLTGPVRGTSGFATEFAARGPRDPLGRSLRDLDLETRLFRYPCSYLIYSDAFRALPDEARIRCWQRLETILWATDEQDGFEHLQEEDRVAIREILMATHPDVPEDWGRTSRVPKNNAP